MQALRGWNLTAQPFDSWESGVLKIFPHDDVASQRSFLYRMLATRFGSARQTQMTPISR